MTSSSRRVSSFAGNSGFVPEAALKIGAEPIDKGVPVHKVDVKTVLREMGLVEDQIGRVLITGKLTTMDYNGRMILSEFGQLMKDKGFDVALRELSTLKPGEDFSWVTSTLDEDKEHVRDVQKAELIVIARDDIGTCRKCKYNLITVKMKQMRGADEPFDVIYRCANCGAGGSQLDIKDSMKSRLIDEIMKRDLPTGEKATPSPSQGGEEQK